MCLTIPKKVLSVNSKFIVGQSAKGKKEKMIASLVKIKKGDWVLTQNGVIIKKITAVQKREINKLLRNKKGG
jgi:hydrogenase maturation factor